MLRAAKHWNRLHKVVMDSLSLETLCQAGRGSEHLDLAVGVPVHCKGVELDDL